MSKNGIRALIIVALFDLAAGAAITHMLTRSGTARTTAAHAQASNSSPKT